MTKDSNFDPENLIEKYLKARQEFLDFANQKDILKGNDNIIGRIGELIAIQFIKEVLKKKVSKTESVVQKGFDLEYEDGKTISVKIMTGENTSGSASKLKSGWDEFIFIELDKEYFISKIGHLTQEQFQKALKENDRRSEEPRVSRYMLGDKGLFSKYGKRYHSKDLSTYNLILTKI